MQERPESGLIVTSVTYAMRAKEILLRYGIRAFAERISPQESGCGCGYGLRVRGDGQRARAILEEHKIVVKGFYEPFI